jgi:hypothetical protein
MEGHSVIAGAGMVMRGAKPVQRMPEAKQLGASMGCAEPHGHGGRASSIRGGRVVGINSQLPTSNSQGDRPSGTLVRLKPDTTVDTRHSDRRRGYEGHSVIAGAGMVMRGATPVQRMPEAKQLGASMGCAEPHGHGGRASSIRGGRVVGSTPNVQLPTPKDLASMRLGSWESAVPPVPFAPGLAAA